MTLIPLRIGSTRPPALTFEGLPARPRLPSALGFAGSTFASAAGRSPRRATEIGPAGPQPFQAMGPRANARPQPTGIKRSRFERNGEPLPIPQDRSSGPGDRPDPALAPPPPQGNGVDSTSRSKPDPRSPLVAELALPTESIWTRVTPHIADLPRQGPERNVRTRAVAHRFPRLGFFSERGLLTPHPIEPAPRDRR